MKDKNEKKNPQETGAIHDFSHPLGVLEHVFAVEMSPMSWLSLLEGR